MPGQKMRKNAMLDIHSFKTHTTIALPPSFRLVVHPINQIPQCSFVKLNVP